MNSRIVLTASAITLALLGVLFSFLPHEILFYFGLSTSAPLSAFVQMTGALYFSMAVLNWMTRKSPSGGIYNRPVVFANFAHYFIAGIALIKAVMAQKNNDPLLIVLMACYIIFALLFGRLLFVNPPIRKLQ